MTDYYVQIDRQFTSPMERFWAVDDDIAHQDIVPSELGTHLAEPNRKMLDTLRNRFQGSDFHKTDLSPGEYYPRMARPSSMQPNCSPGNNPDDSATAHNIRTTSTGQLHALIQQLQEICKVVHPCPDNFAAYGHGIRNLIIIACTEVEAHWKNILKANSVTGKCTHDYVRLSRPMRLTEYRIALPWYPWLDPIIPFENWFPSETPSKDLPWYDAYNKIKHDRENNFAEAKLENALKALAGCFVMLCGQYGWGFARKGEAAGDAFFRLIDAPQWEPSEIYVPGVPRPVPYPFGT